MDYRVLGSSELNVSRIGFGSWGIGGPPFWTNEGDMVSQKTILRAFDLGINFFDTAPVYGFGHAEELIGKTLRSKRSKVILATKCGLRWEQKDFGGIRRDCTKISIKKEINWSLKRLQTDYIDLYQVHWPDDKIPQQETAETLLELQNEGKIRYFGVSNYSFDQVKECFVHAPIVSIQNEYNLLQRNVEIELRDFCVNQKIGILAYSPLASGILTGKFHKNSVFEDWRKNKKAQQFRGQKFSENINKAEKLKRLAVKSQVTCSQIAINWILNQEGITAALVGVKNEDQLIGNIKSIDLELNSTDQRKINKIFGENLNG